jgi:hypothetical protein
MRTLWLIVDTDQRAIPKCRDAPVQTLPAAFEAMEWCRSSTQGFEPAMTGAPCEARTSIESFLSAGVTRETAKTVTLSLRPDINRPDIKLLS